MAAAVETWLDKLSGAVFPVPRALLRALEGLPVEVGSQARVALYQRDPLLSARVLSEIGRQRQPVDTLDQAPGLLGPERFGRLSEGPALEETLTGPAIVAYLQAVKRANAIGHIAYDWSRTLGYRQPRQFYVAGQLAYLAEMAIRAIEPDTARTVDLHLGSGSVWSGGETAVLGSGQAALSLALATAWKLPDLLVQSLTPGQSRLPKVRLVHQARQALELAAEDPRSPRLDRLLEDISESSSESVSALRRGLFRAVVAAAREFNEWYPAKLETGRQVSLYPLPFSWPVPKVAPKTAPSPVVPSASSPVPPGAPSPVLPGASSPMPPGGSSPVPPGASSPVPPGASSPVPPGVSSPVPPGASSPVPPGTPSPVPPGSTLPPPLPATATAGTGAEIRGGGDVDGSAQDAHLVIQEAIERVSRLQGVKRSVFSVITRDRKNIVGRYWNGVPKDSPLRAYEVKRDGDDLFAKLLRKSQRIRVYSGNREKFEQLFDADSRRLFGEVSMVAGSVFIREKPIGILYADDGDGKRELSLETFQQFKRIVDEMVIRLEAL